jgi:glycosyltransferase involved in cell wall biosynthesis
MSASRSLDESIRGLGVIIPANNEERLLRAALDSLERSLTDITDEVLDAHVAVIVDSCRDASESIARAWKRHTDRRRRFSVAVVVVDVGNVGRARAVGCDEILKHFHAHDLARVWLATTDADSRVPPQWLRAQLRHHQLGADAWAGRVEVTDWPRHRRNGADAWQRAYDAESHPIHGASLGVSAKSYVGVNGFQPLQTGEDRALFDALLADGADIHYDASAPVATSARRHARAPDGFATALTRFDVAAHVIINERHVGLT